MLETVISKPAVRQINLMMIEASLALLWGIFAIVVNTGMPEPLIKTFGVLNIAASLLSFVFLNANRKEPLPHQWLMIEAMVELVAGVVFLLMVTSLEQFRVYFSYGIVFIAFLQFIYGYTLLMSGRRNTVNILIRFGVSIAGMFLFLLLYTNVWGLTTSIVVIGIFSILYGLANAYFSSSLRLDEDAVG